MAGNELLVLKQPGAGRTAQPSELEDITSTQTLEPGYYWQAKRSDDARGAIEGDALLLVEVFSSTRRSTLSNCVSWPWGIREELKHLREEGSVDGGPVCVPSRQSFMQSGSIRLWSRRVRIYRLSSGTLIMGARARMRSSPAR